MKAFLLDYLLERTYLPWLSTQEQGASLVGRTVRRSRARKLKLTGSSSEWDTALLPPHSKRNYTPAKVDRNALWLTPVYMRLVTTQNCLQTLLTNPCRCPGRNSAAGIYFHPEENTLSWTAEARQTVHIWERIKSQLSTEDLQDSVEIWNRSHKVSGNMTGSHLSQSYLLVPIAQLPQKPACLSFSNQSRVKRHAEPVPENEREAAFIKPIALWEPPQIVPSASPLWQVG